MWKLTRFNLTLGSWASWVYGAIFVLTLYEVLMRYAFNAPTIWSLELNLMLVAIGYTIGGLLPTAGKSHLRIDSVYARMPSWARRACDVTANLIGVGYCAAITWAGTAQAWTAIQVGERSGSAWNSWLPVLQKGIIPVAGCLMTLQLLVHLLERDPPVHPTDASP
ncbi:MAG: TRAP transporter small permease [Burkholderiaceae bacterium]|jgi:TRAP-type C4-dicarboxylate transport system permease small subunit|nr:TRAP transporter small permease [Burkholderiaceae bacterium]